MVKPEKEAVMRSAIFASIVLASGLASFGASASDPQRLTENELSDFSRLWHDGCGKTIIEAQDVDQNHSAQV